MKKALYKHPQFRNYYKQMEDVYKNVLSISSNPVEKEFANLWANLDDDGKQLGVYKMLLALENGDPVSVSELKGFFLKDQLNG